MEAINSCQAEKSEAKVEKTIEMENTEKTIIESTKVGNSVEHLEDGTSTESCFQRDPSLDVYICWIIFL